MEKTGARFVSLEGKVKREDMNVKSFSTSAAEAPLSLLTFCG